MALKESAEATFEVRFVAPDLLPEKIPLRAVSDALSAVQDLACRRDPYETSHVPPEKGIGLVDVQRGSAVYCCVSHAPDEARANLAHLGMLLSSQSEQGPVEDETLVTALRPIESLSDVARSIGGRIEVALVDHGQPPLFAVGEDDFQRISTRLLFRGDTTVVGVVERVGGATSMRCLLRVSGRRRILYCDVETKELVRQLGQHLYEQVAATGSATWIHRTWRIYRFKIRDFTQPCLGEPGEALEQLRNAGLNAWDHIADPDAFIRELRS
jgi:hypothetical protein